MSKLPVPGVPDVRVEVVLAEHQLECLIGNTLIQHKPLSAHIYPAYWSWRLGLRKWRAVLVHKAHRTCRCGYRCREAEVFEYHVAREVIQVLEDETDKQLQWMARGVSWA